MKVLMVTPGVLPVPPVAGGAVETLVQQLVESLEKSTLDDIQLTVFSTDDPRIDKQTLRFLKTRYRFFKYTPARKFISGSLGKVFLKFGISRTYFNIYLRAVSRLLSQENFDYVIVQNQSEFLLPLRCRTKAKSILHLHNDKLNADSQFAARIAQACDGIITVSDYIKRRVETVPSIEPRDVKSLLNCVDVNRFSAERDPDTSSDLRQRLGITQTAKVILFVGRLDPTKGVLELVQAFNTLKQDDVCLLIVGSAWFGSNTVDRFLANLKAEAAESPNQVVFAGFVPHAEIPLFHHLADVVVVPSICEDACPLVVLEGMASGNPVIATDSGGIPEMISEDCGIIVPRTDGLANFPVRLGNALSSLLVDERKRREFGHNARDRAGKFAADDFARRFFRTLSEFGGD